jgi:hypothetical protein
MFNLTFLNSGIVALAAVALVPLLIYLFARKKPQRVIFSSLRFIRQSQHQQRRRINIKNILLLIIRMLIILLTILAIARPAVKASFLQSSTLHPKTAIGIILDTSYSMEYLIDTATELDRGKAIVSQINQMLNADDRTLLLTTDAAWNSTHGTLRYGPLEEELIASIASSTVNQPIEDVITQATQLLRSSHYINQELYFISDMQYHELPDSLDIPFFIIPTSSDTVRANISCQNVVINDNIVQKERATHISFEVVNHAPFAQRDVLCKLIVDDQTVAEKMVQLQPQQRLAESFAIPVTTDGTHSGYVEVRNERLTADNRCYFSWHHTSHPQVAVVSQAAALPPALEAVVEIYSGSGYTIIPPQELSVLTLSRFHTVIFYRQPTISPRLLQVLSDFETQGGGILYIAAEDASDDELAFLASQFNCTFESFNQSRPAAVNQINTYHPALRLMPEKLSTTLNSFWRVRSSANVLMRATSPVILDNSTSLLWLFDPAAQNNPLLLDPAYPVMAYATFGALRGIADQAQSRTAGESITVNGPLTLPSGKALELHHTRYRLLHPGLYKTATSVIAVNPDYTESDYTRLQKQDLPTGILLSENWQDAVLQSRYGFELWKYLLAAVLVLVTLEMLLVKGEEKISH